MRFFLTAMVITAFTPCMFAQRPPMKPVDVIGVDSCAECHDEMVDSWRSSVHAESFRTLVLSAKAKEMAKKLDIAPSEIPMKASCVRCHFTQEYLASMPQPTEAVSCESCHGEGFDWIDQHYKKSISRSERIERAGELGMIHPGDTFKVTQTCYECHVIDDEQLVNLAGHPAMSEDFEILSWYSGEVAHNYLVQESGRATKRHSETLQPVPQERRRMLYLTGKLQHVAFTLRAIARAKDPPVDREGRFIELPDGNYTYAVQHAVQLRRLELDLKKVLHQVTIPQYTKTIAILRGLNLKTGNGREMELAAMQIGQQAQVFTEKYSGGEFGEIDPLLAELRPRYSEHYAAIVKALEIRKLAESQSSGASDEEAGAEQAGTTDRVEYVDGGDEGSSEIEERMEEATIDGARVGQ
ncbi:MAG: hypothetical protein HRU46_21220 [Verrucomicrobiales bacterium]|nr:hypothetical protein [Verrucomicrobiales bacterium]